MRPQLGAFPFQGHATMRLRYLLIGSLTGLAVAAAALYGVGRTIDHAITNLFER